MSKLTKKQQIFVAEYLKDKNGSRAAIAAGYSEKGAHVAAIRLLRKATVSEEIERKHSKMLAKLEISAEKVLQGIADLAFFDMRKFYNEDGTLKSVPDLDDQTQAALSGMEVEKVYDHFGKGQAQEKGTLTKIKVADRGLNLERLGRHFKLFTDKIEHSGMDSLAEEIQKARLRAHA